MTAPVSICPVCGYRGPKLEGEKPYCPNAVSAYGNPVTLVEHARSRMQYVALGLVDSFPSVDGLAEAAVFYECYFHAHATDFDVDSK